MRVYLDFNATAPLRPEAKAAMLAVLETTGNAQSVHAEGRQARGQIEKARRQVARLVDCSESEIVFTSGGSEANALALRGAIQGAAESGERITRLIVSAIEHDSVLANAALCEATNAGLRVAQCPVTTDGVIDLAELRRLLREGKGRTLVSVMAANNETGVIQPIADVVAEAKSVGALVHCDAVQAAGKVPFSFAALGLDYATLSSHKIGGPQGVGALAARAAAPLTRQIAGGGQERGFRAGTENVAGIAGYGAAAEAALVDLNRMGNVRTLRDDGERKLNAACADAVVFGRGADRSPNTICVAVSGISAENLVIALDLDGFAVSAGAACSSGKVRQSHVLTAMGVDPALAQSAIRISFGVSTTAEDLNRFIEAWARIVKRASTRAAA
ncbi:MAG: aminotransferase class V-fold PLP-dependent enzyme [Alphaproteobacteria bacterium]|nr:aminotransferase class V-fold PLP-dependent enzyme [Alphaproteobacteria bacterium]